MKIEIYDTTLRDGEQGAGVSLSAADKLDIITALDLLGVDYIEAGTYMKGSRDIGEEAVFNLIDYKKYGTKITAFCSTRRAGTNIEDDAVMQKLISSEIQNITVVGKANLYHVEKILHTNADENLSMIYDTIKFLSDKGKNVLFDAEHFFDGYKNNSEYSLSAIETAFSAGAGTAVLCDTNGGTLPDLIGTITGEVCKKFNSKKIAIHCHNDIGMAEAAALQAAVNGAVQIQGSISGVGERCGNSDLCTLIPLLQLKLGYSCIADDKLRLLTSVSRQITEIANLPFNEKAPFIGGYAFAHKAGMHIDGVSKDPKAFEHIKPEQVGNERNILISSMSGRAAIYEKMTQLTKIPAKDSYETQKVLEIVKKYEAYGYQYENAEASLSLIIRESLGIRKKFYTIKRYQVTINESENSGLCVAIIKVSVNGVCALTAAEGGGPVNALDCAMRDALGRFYPEIKNIRLTDYKVRVISSHDATASKVRVTIETTDGCRVWRTIGVSADIVDASRQALDDSFEYFLYEN